MNFKHQQPSSAPSPGMPEEGNLENRRRLSSGTGSLEPGICSWSLNAGDTAELVRRLGELGLSHVHLALAPLMFLDDKRKHQQLGNLGAAGIEITAGMIAFPGEDYSTIEKIRLSGGFVPDSSWPLRRQLVLAAARLAREMNISLLTTHAGFIPPSDHADYPKILRRAGELADEAAPLDVTLGLETGQESAAELLQFLADLNRPNIAVNFDPGNFILYGSDDPITAVKTLGRHIRHVHVKDAKASSEPGIIWGAETEIGRGGLDLGMFLGALTDVEYGGALVIECERARSDDELRRSIQRVREEVTRRV